jgi:photosystem II stability/assembly factor-like uncharacterized protein
MTGLMSSVSAGGTAALYAPIVLSNFNLRGARTPLFQGVTTLSNDGTTQPPVALIDFGVSFVAPNWYYNVALQNRDASTTYDILAAVRYQIAPLQSPRFYGGTYDDATTLTYTWTEQSSVTAASYSKLNINDTGTTAICHRPGQGIYVVTNANTASATWTLSTTGITPGTTSFGQGCLARSSPTIMYCAAGVASYPYKSTDTGATWTQLSTPNNTLAWASIKCNYNGTIVFAAQTNGSLYLSGDGGTSWTQQSGAGVRNWAALYLSDDGQVLVATVNSGNIWVSVNGGGFWTPRATSRLWQVLTGTSDGGLLLAAASSPGPGVASLYLSTDYGTTWTATAASQVTNASIAGLACSINGNKLMVSGLANSIPFVYRSQNGGTTWVLEPAPPSGTLPAGIQGSVAMTPDGTTLLATGNAGTPLRPYFATGV